MGTLFPDTHPDAERLRIEGLPPMPSRRKMELMAGMCASAKTLTLAGLRRRHPGESPARLRRRPADLILGPELLARPDGPLLWKGQRCTTNRSLSPAVTDLLTRALPEAHGPNDKP